MPRATWTFVAAALALGATACDPKNVDSPDAGPADAGLADAGPGIRHDLSTGAWTLEPISNTPGTISHDAVLAYTDDGALWAAWAEPDPIDFTNQDIWAASKPAGGAWTQGEALTAETAQMAFPSIRARGGEVHLAFSGAPGGDLDLFYMKHTASGWSARVDLTSATDGIPAGYDHSPSLALGPNGELAVAYICLPSNPGGPENAVREIRVVRIANGAASGAPELAIPVPATPLGSECFGPAALFDGAGKLHVVADCGPLNDGTLYWATDASGAFVATALDRPADADDTNARLALDPDGATVHLAWLRTLPCATLGGTCGEIFVRRIASGVPGTAINATNTPDEHETPPAFAVDRFGRRLIAFHKMNAQDTADVFFIFSENGDTFSTARNITPGTDASNEWMPWSFAIDPGTGLPHLTYTAIIPNTDPLNTEVIHATYVPR